jgi:hypothetical protein
VRILTSHLGTQQHLLASHFQLQNLLVSDKEKNKENRYFFTLEHKVDSSLSTKINNKYIFQKSAKINIEIPHRIFFYKIRGHILY